MKVTVFQDREKAELGDLFGIFFEDINHAADGGLYGEMIRNRAFEFDHTDNAAYDHLTAWERVGDEDEVKLSVEEEEPVNGRNPHYLSLEVASSSGAGLGVCNRGFNGGLYLEGGKEYDFSCYARKGPGGADTLYVSLEDVSGGVLSLESFALSEEWRRLEAVFKPEASSLSGRLLLTLSEAGGVFLDFVSLFPRDTYRGRRNGMRRDLAELLEEMRPKFMRFPGGCLVHDGSLKANDRDSQYRWKNTLGPVEERPPRRNNWGYNQTLGLGFFEYFQFCEDIGAKPLPVLSGGYDPHHFREASIREVDGEPTGELAEFVQDALDLIEFAKGSPDTPWGGIRAGMGHPEPFSLEYIGIGNEEIGEGFFERFPYFERAIRKADPQIRVIGTSGPFAEGREYRRGWEAARRDHADLVDEHYYQAPEWFITHHHRYDSFDAAGPGVFLGEYASQDNTWYNALAEASYMIGLQNNGDKVRLACYAPLFCNADYVNWKPDLIWFDSRRAAPTPSYHVQKLFMRNQGDVLLETLTDWEGEEAFTEEESLSGELVLQYAGAEASYHDILITGKELGSRQLGGVYNVDGDDCPEISLGKVQEDSYCVRVQARETAGFKGFKIIFGRKSAGNQLSWTLGGWANSDSIIGQDIDGRNSCLAQNAESVKQGKVYDLLLWVKGRRVTTFIDGKLDHDLVVSPYTAEPAYVTVSRERASGDIILKMVNLQSVSRQLSFSFPQSPARGWRGVLWRMGGYAREEQNTLEQPDRVCPVEEEFSSQSRDFVYTLEPDTLCVMRLQGKGSDGIAWVKS